MRQLSEVAKGAARVAVSTGARSKARSNKPKSARETSIISDVGLSAAANECLLCRWSVELPLR